MDGKKVTILRVNYLFKGVPLEVGTHKIEFIYDPVSFKIGSWITIVTFIWILFYFGRILIKRGLLNGRRTEGLRL